MKPAQQWFDEYAESHQNRTNKLIHWVCVPAIFFSIVGLFVSIPSEMLSSKLPDNYAPYVNFGSIGLLLAMVFYLSISWRIFIGMFLLAALVLWGNVQIQESGMVPLWLFSVIVFVVAWIGQFIGHHIEGAKPSFFKDLQFLLVGPAWLMGFVYKRLGLTY